MKSRRILLITATATLGLFAQAAQAAQGYTVRIAMGNEQHAPFTLDEVSHADVSENAEGSTSFAKPIGYAEQGEYNFLHNTKACDGKYEFRVVDKSGVELGQCKVSFGTVLYDGGGCGQAQWYAAKCTSSKTGIKFETSSKGSHHRNFVIK